MADLATLYQGALLGQSLSGKLGETAALGEDVNQDVRANLIQTGVATGKISPASLSGIDAALLQSKLYAPATIPSPPGHRGLFGDILGVAETPFKVALNTAGDFASAVEGIPQGVATLWNAAVNTPGEIGGALGLNPSPPKGPNLVDVAKAIGKQTIRDFTNFDPMHPLYPALDLATLASGGASLAARGGGALARLGEEGSAVARAGEALRGVVAPGERPALTLGGVPTDVTPGDYSISPFRRIAFERPIDNFFNSKAANLHVPGRPEGWTLQDERAAYHIRKLANVTGGRTSATAVNEAARATQPFNQAMHALLGESSNQAQAAVKFNALVLRRMLAADEVSENEALSRLDMYRDKVLTNPLHAVEGIPLNTPEAQKIREFYTNLTNTPEFRSYFSRPTGAMRDVRVAWDDALTKGLKSLGMNPQELLNRSLGPAAHIMERTPEELLREQPVLVQNQTNFAVRAQQLEEALRKTPNERIPQVALIPKMAQLLPGTAPLEEKIRLIHDAFNSLSEDIAGHYSRRDLLNNAHGTGYLPGNTIAQKVASGLVDRLGVDPAIAEPFAVGGLTNYFPQASALGLKVRTQGGPIARAMDRLPGINRGAAQVGLHEFRRDNTTRLLKAQQLGVAPFSDFLHEADLNFFKGGIDRRDPITFARHISQRERVLAHRKLAEPLIARLALKDSDGHVLTFKSTTELQEKLGSTVAADRWRLIPHQALQTLIQSESEAGRDVANVLKESSGHVTPEVSDRIDSIIDEEAQNFDRQLADSVIAKGDGMVAVPAPYVQNLIKHAQVMDAARGPGRLWQGFINRWRTAVLAYMPSWLLRTSIGHGTILFISGVWNPVHYAQASTYFKDGFKIPGTDVHPLRGSERDVPPGVEQGTPHEDFGRFGMQRLSTGQIAQLTTHGVHRIANFQRRAAFISLLNRTTRQRFAELEDGMRIPRIMRTHDLDYVIKNHPELVHHALNELDRISYTFGQMAPWERRLAKNFIPFWGWYKFVSKFVWTLPLTYPGRALALSRLGELGASSQDQLVGPIPEWLRSSILFDTHNLAAVHYLSMLGINPLGDIANPAHGFSGLIRLGQLSPIIQAGLEGMGYNTLTGGLEEIDPASGIVQVNGQYYNIHTGKAYESLDQASPIAGVERAIGGLAREFPEIRIAEPFFTGGRATYPESIPIIHELPIPSATPKVVTPLQTALQYFGVAPKTYNLQKYQGNLAKNLRRAQGTFRTVVRKEKALK